MTFEFIAGNLALEFANTVHSQGFADPQDDLRSYADLVIWGRQARLLDQPQEKQLLRASDTANARADFNRARLLRGLIYKLFSVIAQGKEAAPETLAGFNALLRREMARARIQRAGDRYELAWAPNGHAMERVLFEVTRSAVQLLTSEPLDRVRQCAGETCTWLFLDTSRNGRRRWCDMQACGNRAKVRRFRRRGAA